MQDKASYCRLVRRTSKFDSLTAEKEAILRRTIHWTPVTLIEPPPQVVDRNNETANSRHTSV